MLEPFFRPKTRADGRGRPWRDAREVLNGVLCVLRTGTPWHDLPERYPPYQTRHRRFQQWRRTGLFRDVLERLAKDLRDRGTLDLTEGFIDASFTGAKKGLRRRAYETWQRQQNHGNRRPPQSSCRRPRGQPFARASPARPPHARRPVPRGVPARLIGDKAYDGDPLDEELLHECAIDLIAPHKDNRVRPATQAGRPLRRYKRRWTVERFFAWLHNSRRLIVRWEQHVENLLAMLHLAYIRILLRAL